MSARKKRRCCPVDQKQTRYEHITVLSNFIKAEKRVVFISGAGLSVASGIPTFRGEDNSVWETTLTSWGTRAKFVEDPLVWYNKFWSAKHMPFYPAARPSKPNGGHRAISELARQHEGITVVTQNVDTLHIKSGMPTGRLVEVHGQLGLHKCITEGCIYTLERSVSGMEYDWKQPAKAKSPRRNFTIKSTPKCPACGEDLMPQALMFDEMYESHSHYQWQKVLGWFSSADVFVFVGTSFAVNVTAEAVAEAHRRQLPVFNFNVVEEGALASVCGDRLHHIHGKCEETLKQLQDAVSRATSPAKANVSEHTARPAKDASFAQPPSSAPSQSSLNTMIVVDSWVACDGCDQWTLLGSKSEATEKLEAKWFCDSCKTNTKIPTIPPSYE